MNTHLLLSVLCSILLTTTSGMCQAATSPKASPRQPNNSRTETRLLQQLLKMEDQQLVNLRQTIEHIEQMTPEEKVEMRGRIGTIRKMPPEKVAAMRKQYKDIPKEQREAMRDRWLQMSPEARAEWRDKLRSMSREARQAAFREQGFLPPPPNRDKKSLHPTHQPDDLKSHPQRPQKREPIAESEIF